MIKYNLLETLIMLGLVFLTMIPLLFYLAFFDKKRDGEWLGLGGYLFIQLLRKIKRGNNGTRIPQSHETN